MSFNIKKQTFMSFLIQNTTFTKNSRKNGGNVTSFRGITSVTSGMGWP